MVTAAALGLGLGLVGRPLFRQLSPWALLAAIQRPGDVGLLTDAIEVRVDRPVLSATEPQPAALLVDVSDPADGPLAARHRTDQRAVRAIVIEVLPARGNVSFYDSKQSDYSFTKPYSEATAETIDLEVRNLISTLFDTTKKLLSQKKKELEVVAKELLSKEIIFQSDLERLIGKRPFAKPTTYQAFTNGEPQKEDKAKKVKTPKSKAKSQSKAEPLQNGRDSDPSKTSGKTSK